MQIKVRSGGTPHFEQDLNVYSLTFNFRSSAFEMPAGGYLIPAPKSFDPVSIHVQWTTCFINFETEQEAKDFCDWLRSADEQSQDSFTRMLD